MPEPIPSAMSRSGSASDRVLGTIVLVLFLLGVAAIAWYRGLADGAMLRYVGAAAVGAILFIVMVMTARDAMPRRLAVLLGILIILLLLSRCGGPATARGTGPEPTPPWAGDPVPPVVPAPAPKPVTPPAPAPVPAPAPAPQPPMPLPPPVVAKERPPEPLSEPARVVDLTQFMWERFVWDPQTGGSWGRRQVPYEVRRTWSIDTARNAPNLIRLKRERDARPGSHLEWNGRWPDGSSGTRLFLPTVEPTADDFKKLEDMTKKDADMQFVWEIQVDGVWAWRKLDQREQPPGGVRDSSTDTGEYQRLKAEQARVPGSTLEWSGHWSDGGSGWRLVLPSGAAAPVSPTVPRGQALRSTAY